MITTHTYPGGEAVQAEPAEVTCPTCDAAPNAACVYRLAGDEWDLTGWHEERAWAADVTQVCPACGGTDLSGRTGTWAGLDYDADACDDCGWVGDPR